MITETHGCILSGIATECSNGTPSPVKVDLISVTPLTPGKNPLMSLQLTGPVAEAIRSRSLRCGARVQLTISIEPTPPTPIQ